MREKLAPCSIDVIVTSPPCNLGIKYKRYDDTVPRQRYLEWQGEWADVVKRVLRDDGSLFLNIGSKQNPKNVHSTPRLEKDAPRGRSVPRDWKHCRRASNRKQ